MPLILEFDSLEDMNKFLEEQSLIVTGEIEPEEWSDDKEEMAQ